MYLTVKQQVKHLSKKDYLALKELSHTAKNLANQAIYNIRQYYFTANILTIKRTMLCLKIARTIRFSIPTWHSRYLKK